MRIRTHALAAQLLYEQCCCQCCCHVVRIPALSVVAFACYCAMSGSCDPVVDCLLLGEFAGGFGHSPGFAPSENHPDGSRNDQNQNPLLVPQWGNLLWEERAHRGSHFRRHYRKLQHNMRREEERKRQTSDNAPKEVQCENRQKPQHIRQQTLHQNT